MSAAGDKLGLAVQRQQEAYADGRPLPMVRWYSPLLLLRTGIRVVTASMVRGYATRRELQAALSPQNADDPYTLYDYSKPDSADSADAGGSDTVNGSEIWFDYVADAGDGWNSAHTVARALAAPRIEAGGHRLPRGRFLVMGGDQVYPDPSREAYRARLIQPYRAALPKDLNGEEGPAPDLFALPGNHDWYDGLNAFSGVFLRNEHNLAGPDGNRIGGWHLQQSRSYFALKLPRGWWLWGIDGQLDSAIDPPQAGYFAGLAARCVKKGDRIILCIAEPAWVQAERSPVRLENLKSIAGIIGKCGAELRAVLTGDLHHYARYSGPGAKRHLITAGGGGAFLHPTHVLPREVAIDWPEALSEASGPETFRREITYPATGLSRALAWKNLLLPFNNIDFAVAIGAGYALLVWFLESQNFPSGGAALDTAAAAGRHGSFADAAMRFLTTLPKSPEFAALALLMLGMQIRLSASRKAWQRIVLGGSHWMAHMAALIVVYCGAVEINTRVFGLAPGTAGFMVALLAEMVVFGGCLGALVFGANLLMMLNGFRLHWTDAFSSLRIEDYKNFLRLHIGTDGALTIYPMKIDTVRRDVGSPLKRGRDASAPELIEPPIRIE